jgi:hypothetical protein
MRHRPVTELYEVPRARSIRDPASELPRISLPRTLVNRPDYISKYSLATASSDKNHPFEGCANPHKTLHCSCRRSRRQSLAPTVRKETRVHRTKRAALEACRKEDEGLLMRGLDKK